MCAPLISRDGQQQSRGVNSCIRVLIIAVMRLCLRAPRISLSLLSFHWGEGTADGECRLTLPSSKKKKRRSYLSGFLARVAPFKWRYHHRRWRRSKLTKETGTLRRPVRKNNAVGSFKTRTCWRTALRAPRVNEKRDASERLGVLVCWILR